MRQGTAQVAIVGGGPVGLFLACALSLRGVSCRVLEKRLAISPHSRAIGIHPCALRELAVIGAAEKLIADGVPIRNARAYYGDYPLGKICFKSVLSPPYDFILSVPQSITERILMELLNDIAPGALLRGACFEGLSQEKDGVRICYTSEGQQAECQACYLIGCDGVNSLVRQRAGISFKEESYPDTYVMGDFEGDAVLGNEAVLLLSRRGIVESFPLPDAQRRWVLHTTDTAHVTTDADYLRQEVRLRTGFVVDPTTCTMFSTFGVRSGQAESFVKGRVALSGDAAHVCSPMGGQGMNLGILGAAKLVTALTDALHDKARAPEYLMAYNREQQRVGKIVAQRAAFNTRLGRGTPTTLLQALVIAALIRLPALHNYFARRFTMQNLPFPHPKSRKYSPVLYHQS